jgi:hypothetical protein
MVSELQQIGLLPASNAVHFQSRTELWRGTVRSHLPQARLWPTSELPTTHQPRPRHYGRELGQNVDVPKRKITSAELC